MYTASGTVRNYEKDTSKNHIWDFFKKFYKYGATVFWINIVIVCVFAPMGAILGLNIQKYTPAQIQ